MFLLCFDLVCGYRYCFCFDRGGGRRPISGWCFCFSYGNTPRWWCLIVSDPERWRRWFSTPSCGSGSLRGLASGDLASLARCLCWFRVQIRVFVVVVGVLVVMVVTGMPSFFMVVAGLLQDFVVVAMCLFADIYGDPTFVSGFEGARDGSLSVVVVTVLSWDGGSCVRSLKGWCGGGCDGSELVLLRGCGGEMLK
ncbi:hypothetical protein L195_g033969 [Trifolium pratense]|uniref:Transmembrane protein n=1 Tax=Trifolium pratense TaxID=57577 RepID=A0A2K3LHK4_TRIPR|nr:hypothetical protein L195_g033969 [Trifolium pratense]